jgi:hypothetical protein
MNKIKQAYQCIINLMVLFHNNNLLEDIIPCVHSFCIALAVLTGGFVVENRIDSCVVDLVIVVTACLVWNMTAWVNIVGQYRMNEQNQAGLPMHHQFNGPFPQQQSAGGYYPMPHGFSGELNNPRMQIRAKVSSCDCMLGVEHDCMGEYCWSSDNN